MVTPLEQQGFWSTIKEALRGTKEDLTAISIRRAVVLLAIPTVLEMSMESLLTVVDIFFVSKLGPDAVATVGLTESMLSFVYAVAMGLSAGATAMISRKVGEKDLHGAAVAAVQAMLAATVWAAAFGVVGIAWAPKFLEAMGATRAVVGYGSGYFAVMLGGNITIFLLYVINAIFRSAGDAAVAMRALWLANILNMVLAPCLIFGVGPFPAMGVVGAAVATTSARAMGVLYQLVLLLRGREKIALRVRHLAVEWPVMREMSRIASGGTVQVLIETASWLALVRLLASFGSSVLAGYTIAMRVGIFALLPSWGLAGAAATLVGQNLGAKEPGRAERSVRTVALYNTIFLGLVSAVFVVKPQPIVELITHDPEVLRFAAECLRIVALGFVFFAFGMVAIQAFNGAGDTSTPMFINLICFWCVKIPLAYGLATWLGMGPRGVFLAITAAYSMQACIAGALFRRGRWKSISLAPGS